MRKTFSSLLLPVLISALLLSTIGASLASQGTGDEITKANWQQHPKIKQIRTIVQAVKAGMSRKALTTKRRNFEYCEPYEDVGRVIATDSSGRVRFYLSDASSDDSALKMEHYYDEAGRLRFVFITGGAANGSQLEHRIYFDETGKRIWEEPIYKKGPGYTWPQVWPDEQLQINDPSARFSSKSPCPEVKPGAGRQKRSRV
jgi:hypothetical protein